MLYYFYFKMTRTYYYNTEPTNNIRSNKECAHGLYTTISNPGTSTKVILVNKTPTKVFFYLLS